ncbi:GNAT family N-acetyltransferase [Alloalcanivorax gelatiniphagus]
MSPIEVRHAEDHDVPALTAVRAHYVLHTHSAFDVVPPTAEEMRAWVAQFAEDSPHQLLVAVEDARLLGYAATLRYRPKPAFDGTAELSVYLAPDSRSRGVGSALYDDLLARSARQGTRTFLAGVALPNDASVAFHLKHGFREVGTFEHYAHKWDRDISTTWFQRHA